MALDWSFEGLTAAFICRFECLSVAFLLMKIRKKKCNQTDNSSVMLRYHQFIFECIDLHLMEIGV